VRPFEERAPELDGDLGDIKARVRGRLAKLGVMYRPNSGQTAFPFDPIPRVLGGDEWRHLETGIAQRARALSAFVADAYGDRRIVAEGVVPSRVIDTAEHYEPSLRHVTPPGGQWVGIAGLDLVRGPDGAFLVLEDNLLTPSGFGYAAVAREAIVSVLEPPPGAAPHGYDDLPRLLAGTLRAAAPGGREPYLVVLTDSPENPAYWEHEWAARAIGVPIVVPGDLRMDGDRLMHGAHAVDAVYRRSNDDMLDTDVGRLLEPAIRAGTLGVVNAFGCGVGDDKLAHAYVEDMIRFYLGEEPALHSVSTLDLGRPEQLERALDTFADLVVKPRAGQGGIGVVVCPHAEAADVEELRDRVRDSPEEWVAQPFVELSLHATLVDGTIAHRHVDLRPFAFMQGAEGAQVLTGGLTRFAMDEGAVVVNTTLNGGFKDTWVLDR
jgi:uncharacterized circularly permuted ATP-grasp superfamily protein